MQEFYNKFNKKTFKIICILICAIGDISILAFIYKYFIIKETFQKIIQIHPSLNMQIMDAEMLNALYHFYSQSLSLLLFLAVIAHSVIYILFWYKKRAATAYLKLLSLLGAPTCLLCLPQGLQLHSAFIWFIPQAALYIFVFLGFFYSKKILEE